MSPPSRQPAQLYVTTILFIMLTESIPAMYEPSKVSTKDILTLWKYVSTKTSSYLPSAFQDFRQHVFKLGKIANPKKVPLTEKIDNFGKHTVVNLCRDNTTKNLK